MNCCARTRRAFTLIEMLTVLAIIGILAGILVPTVIGAMKAVKIKVAASDISSLKMAVSAYQMTYGAPPPDNGIGLRVVSYDTDGSGAIEADEAIFPDTLSPNECLIWFLTREFSPDTDKAGFPFATTAWDPAAETEVFARTAFKGGFDPKIKQTRDVDDNRFKEFVDPWGRPYMYKAYPLAWANASAAASVSVSGRYTVTLTLDDPAIGDAKDLGQTRGQINLRGFTTSKLNGNFDFEGVPNPGGPGIVTITFATNPSSGNESGQYRFVLHNKSGVDIYSLGPNGRTRSNARPAEEWQPVDAATLGLWPLVWGTPGDGNDILDGGNILSDERARDDVSNWQ